MEYIQSKTQGVSLQVETAFCECVHNFNNYKDILSKIYIILILLMNCEDIRNN